jgi:hypothetical protein
MVRRASALTGIEVRQLMFENLLDTPLREKYDGIWCCASLLHGERDGLLAVMDALCRALALAGIMYVSVKRIGLRMVGDLRI